jgi:curved DNA-binding protein CbpA
MNQDRTTKPTTERQIPSQARFADSYYGTLELHPAASVIEVRRAYRELSKRYHPDTTALPSAIATVKFQQLNEAYATLSNPERRSLYDLKIGYSRWNVIQVPSDFHSQTPSVEQEPKSTYLDPSDRPLSAGEIFALFMMIVTVLGCLILAIGIAWLRGDPLFLTSIN